ncbi:MAG TPA: hypothetical protein VGO62_10210, partial [Myxococcota bacterium]
MLAALLLLSLAGGDPVDPSDPAGAPSAVAPSSIPAPSSILSTVHARARIKSVNAVSQPDADASKLWPLDDVVLSADRSGSDDGAALAYAWSVLDRPAGSTVFVAAPGADADMTAADAHIVFRLDKRTVGGLDEAGLYRVQVVVTSSTGATDAAEVDLRVAWPSGRPPPEHTAGVVPDARHSSGAVVAGSAAVGCCLGAAISGAGC